MCVRFDFYGMPEMSRLHVCVDLILNPSGKLMDIGLLSGCTFSTGVSGRNHFQ